LARLPSRFGGSGPHNDVERTCQSHSRRKFNASRMTLPPRPVIVSRARWPHDRHDPSTSAGIQSWTRPPHRFVPQDPLKAARFERRHPHSRRQVDFPPRLHARRAGGGRNPDHRPARRRRCHQHGKAMQAMGAKIRKDGDILDHQRRRQWLPAGAGKPLWTSAIRAPVAG
jgi:hypothetical protein